jgi:hypothetical protein
MISNKYVGIALVSLLVLVLGAMVTIIVMLSSEQRPVQASGAALGRYIVTTMKISANEEALAVMNTSNNSIIVYRCWNGNTLYPVSGRYVKYDHDIFKLLNSGHFNNVRPLAKNYVPAVIEKMLEDSSK